MRTLKQSLSQLFCCFGHGAPDGDGDGNAAAPGLATLQNHTSALSIALPAFSVPHAHSGTTLDLADADALREIFRSSSSVRGYQTASLPTRLLPGRPSSQDPTFALGPKQGERKQPGRLEELGSNVKKKLSESRLSRSSIKADAQPEALPAERPPSDGRPLSQANAGCGTRQPPPVIRECLLPCSMSDGGYDSDAKSIKSSVLIANDERTITTSGSIGGRAGAAANETVCQTACQHTQSAASTSDAAEKSKQPPHPGLRSLSQVLLADQEMLPAPRLDRLSVGLSDGTITLPDMSDLGNRPAPSPDSLAGRETTKTNSAEMIAEARKRLSDTATVAKRESLLSVPEDPRASLVSVIDPNLLNFITKHNHHFSPGTPPEHPHRPESTDTSPPTSKTVEQVPKDVNVLKREATSLAESDRSSLHLYNMRISQRLAGSSFVDFNCSRPNTSQTANQIPEEDSALWHPGSDQGSRATRLSGRIRAEHNRRPSDPQTRRLFEDDNARILAHSQWKTVTSISSAISSGQSRMRMGQDDASSFYWSDGEVGAEDEQNMESRQRHPNSFAVGGRSESISLPIDSSLCKRRSPLQGEGIWFGREVSQRQTDQTLARKCAQARTRRSRSASMPVEHEFRESRLLPRSERITTEANDAMSEAGRIHDAKRERMTEISVQAILDLCNERLSEIEPPCPDDITDPRIRLNRPSSSPATVARQSIAHCDRLSTDRHRQNSLAQPDYSLSTSQEFATNILHRTFPRVQEESHSQSFGGFLTPPKFGRDGRRRSTQSSVSVIDPTTENPRNTQESANDCPEVEDETAMRDYSKILGLVPRMSPRTSITFGELLPRQLKGKPDDNSISKKKNAVDISELPTPVVTSSCGERPSRAHTPLRELVSLWSHFPSHTKKERAGLASHRDKIAVRDFVQEQCDENGPTGSGTRNRSTPSTGLRTPGSWKMLSFSKKTRLDKAKSRSMPLPRSSSAKPFADIRLKQDHKGPGSRWRKLHRGSDSNWRVYDHSHSHRSISVGAGGEDVEHEAIPSVDVLDERSVLHFRSEVEGTIDDECENQVGLVIQPPALAEEELPPLDDEPWATRFHDCVGSLSALKSDTDLAEDVRGDDGRLGPEIGSSEELRGSTVDFVRQLGQQRDEERMALLRRMEVFGQNDRNT